MTVDMTDESEEWDPEERETVSWEMGNEVKEKTEGKGNGKDAEDSTTTTAKTEEGDEAAEGQQSENQDMNIEEDWHVSETSTQLGMIDVEAQSQAAK